jgi:hypothetical protein
MLDQRYPPVRRLAHGLQFCRLLDASRLDRLEGDRLISLLAMFETSAVEESGVMFRARKPPERSVAGMFRQVLFEYVRLHPKANAEKSWRSRLRLVRGAAAFARGKGRVPDVDLDFPQTTFEDLQRPLGRLPIEVAGPLYALFEAASASKHYALLERRRWPLVDSFRALALGYPVALCLLRLCCSQREPTRDDAIDVVGAIDRGQTYAPLCGRRHLHRIRGLAQHDGLTRLLAWYAR